MFSSFNGSFKFGKRRVPIAVGPVSGDPSLSLGTLVAYTDNTLFDTWTASSSTTTDAGNSVTTVWQMFYAHKAIRLLSGTAGLRIGTRTSGSNTWGWGISVSSANNTQGSFGSVTSIGSQNASYVSGGTYTTNITTTVNIPANRYFIIGRRTGPFYYAARNLAENRTATINNESIFTVINRIWVGGSDSTFIIPSALGGSGTYTQTNNISQVAGFAFDVV